jgi:hypothetical protein
MDETHEITLSVELHEAVAIVNLLGSLPTTQGAYPLWKKLHDQVKPLLPPDAPS